MKRFIRFDNKDRSSGLKLLGVGVLIFLVLLGLELSLPFYYPSYATVENTFHSNFKEISLTPGKGVLVANINVTKDDNTLIAFIDDQNDKVNVTVVGNGNSLTNAIDFTETLPPGKYSIYLLDTSNNSYNVGFTYGIFQGSFINRFYSGLGIYQTVLEIGMSLGAVLAIIGLILFLISLRKNRR
ncbi:hypothetical protein [Sulfuracidifex tepidarius]|uniref:Uncharacterized protein n=1 Tax=Sulfuracidifex tepidarius TaxID=1294262 RepID=A0A510E4J4_9CREN|nr:hypothetical protein [Sulfuracidifex tepidarius]BBG24589.1 hypothetical protein IC006_1918 [Sulfuracidifex tepidarius]BBG27377.1 hypothetical protein IC007_1926 [Sulfuracidifex tepidarius]